MRTIWTILLLCLIATIVIYLYPRTWELDLIANLQKQGSTFTTHVLQGITDYVDAVSVGIPVILLIAGFIRRDPSLREKAIIILIAVGLAGLFSNGLKRIVREPRPYEVDNRISQWSGGGGYGFPSGHAADAVAAAAAFSLLWPQWPVVLAFAGWAAVIMFSRVYLGVHDPGDVIAGMFLGVLCAMIATKIGDSLRARLFAK